MNNCWTGGGVGGVDEHLGGGIGGASLKFDGHGDGEYCPVLALLLTSCWCECGLSDLELPAPESSAGLPRIWCDCNSRSILGFLITLLPSGGGGGCTFDECPFNDGSWDGNNSTRTFGSFNCGREFCKLKIKINKINKI